MPADLLIERLNALEDQDLLSLLVGGLRLNQNSLEGLNHNALVQRCSAELRAAAGSSTINLTRNAHDFPYKQLLIDVADKLTPGFTALSWTRYRLKDTHLEEEIEQTILDLFDARVRKWWEKLPPDNKAEFVDGVNTLLEGHEHSTRAVSGKTAPFLQQQAMEQLIQGGLVGGLTKVSASGALGVLGVSVVGQLGWVILVQTIGWMAGLKIAIFGIGGYGALGGAVTALGGAAIGGAVAVPGTVALLDGPAYRKTVPTTVMLLARTRLNRVTRGSQSAN